MSRKGKKTKVARPQAAQNKNPEPQKAAAVKATQQRKPFEWFEMTDQLWFRCAAGVTALAAFLRFFILELRPMHHDEGVNGFFLTNMMRDGLYKYDPANYHGPSIYYLAAPFVELFGMKTIPVRMSVAIFGVLMVVLALYLRRFLGDIGSLVGAFFLAIAPGMLFVSRYFIHEILFIFLSLAVVVAVLFYLEKEKAGRGAIAWMSATLFVCLVPTALLLAQLLTGDTKLIGGEKTTGVWALRIIFTAVVVALVYYTIKFLKAWDGGRPIYLILASVSVAMLFATKETAFITLGTMIIAVGCVWLWKRMKPAKPLNRDWFRIVIAVHVVLIAVALYFRSFIADAWAWTDENYLSGRFQPPEHFAFAAIIFMIAAAIAAWVLFLIELRKTNEPSFAEPVPLTFKTFVTHLGSRKNLILTVAAVAGIFAYLIVLFFSSFFTYAEGVWKAFEAYNIWTKTGGKEHAQNGYFAYLKWGGKIESPLLVIGLLGALIALLKTKHRFAMFTALWAIGLFAAYTIIPYKTPWLALSYLLPFCLVAGYGIGELYAAANDKLKVAAILLFASGSIVLGYQSYQHNFVRYDDDKMPYVYAHTRRGLLGMLERMDYYAAKSGKGADSTIEIVSPDYWPLTWYTLKFNHANYHGRLVDASTAEFIVAKKKDQDAEVIKRYSQHYKYVGMYPLRPGVDFNLLVRRDIADPDTQELSVIPSVPMTP